MSGNIFRHRQATGFFGLAAAVLLVGAASLAQAQEVLECILDRPPGPTRATGRPALCLAGGSIIGSVINNGGTATIGPGDNVTETHPVKGLSLIGGSGFYRRQRRQWICHHERWHPQPQAARSCRKCWASRRAVESSLKPAASTSLITALSWICFQRCSLQHLQLGFSSGGYGEYDMSGGSLGVNAIYLGAAPLPKCSAAGISCWHGGVQANGRFRRLVRHRRVVEQCRWSGGGRQLGQLRHRAESDIHYQPWDLHPGATTAWARRCSSAARVIGVTGTGTFTQNCGTNAIVGCGTCYGSPGGNSSAL